MAKKSIWLQDEDLARLERIHVAMSNDATWRQLRLGWSDVMRVLLRIAMEQAELDYFAELPEGTDPDEYVEAMRDEFDRRVFNIERWIKGTSPPSEQTAAARQARFEKQAAKAAAARTRISAAKKSKKPE